MNRITISLIFLIVISYILPTSAIMYASGQSTDNNADSSTTGGGTTDNSGSSTTTGGGTTTTTTDNSGSSTTGGGTTTTTTTDNSGSSTTGGGTTTTTTDNSATLSTIPTASNNTENTPDLINSILTVHNNERAAVGVPALTWSDDLASGAKTWAEHLATTGEFAHDQNRPLSSESLAGFNPSGGVSAPENGQSRWVNEKNNWNGGTYPSGECASGKVCGHYIAMVAKGETQVGCGTAIGNNFSWSQGNPAGVLVCRYR